MGTITLLQAIPIIFKKKKKKDSIFFVFVVNLSYYVIIKGKETKLVTIKKTRK